MLFIFQRYRVSSFLRNRCFGLFVEFQDPQMQVVERIRSSCTFQVHKVTSMSGEGFLIKRSSMCTKILLRIYSFSVTLRRGPPTSRRQFSVSLPRRDVDFHDSLSHRDVTSNVATSNCILSVTSRRGFLTSRREFL